MAQWQSYCPTFEKSQDQILPRSVFAHSNAKYVHCIGFQLKLDNYLMPLNPLAREYSLRNFVRGSITAWLASCLARLDSVHFG